MADLDTLRPEVADAVSALDETTCMTNPGLKWYATIRAELPRLTDENARLLAANRDAMDHFEQMKAELTIAHHERDRMFLDAREWATRFGEMEARAEKAEAELAALKAMLTWRPVETAPVGEDVLTCAPTIYPWDIECKRADGEWERSDPAPTHWMPLPPPPKGED